MPYLDYGLVEYVFTAAPHLRIHEGWTKWLHRAAFVDMLPPEVVWRRDKVGFETPEQRDAIDVDQLLSLMRVWLY